MLPTYDDCICQLDDSLAEQGGDPEESMVHAALHQPIAGHLAEALFAGNPFALYLARRYIDLPTGARIARGSFLAHLAEDPEREARFRTAVGREDDILNLHLAALYRYVKPGEADPDPVRAPRAPSWPHHQIDWIVKRLRDVFGARQVRLEQTRRPKDHFVVHVFDRTARDGWRQLDLGSMFFTALLSRNSQTERQLEAWIAETQRQFSHKRRNLRISPAKWRSRT
jgi:hypothetical protein